MRSRCAMARGRQLDSGRTKPSIELVAVSMMIFSSYHSLRPAGTKAIWSRVVFPLVRVPTISPVKSGAGRSNLSCVS